MNSQILTNINTFIKKRLIEFCGIFLILVGIFLFLIILTYSPSDPNFIYTPESVEIKNIGGFYGSVISDFLLQSLGLISILLIFNFLSWGVKLVDEKKIKNFISKIFFTLIYLILGSTSLHIFHNNSFWLIDNGNGGFVGSMINEKIQYFSTLIENQHIIYILFVFTFLVLAMCIY